MWFIVPFLIFWGVVLVISWAFCKSAAAGDTYVCRGCGVAVRSEEVIWSEGVPFCSYGCEVR